MVDDKFDLGIEKRWLGRIIRKWKPDLVHTLGLDPAGFYFLSLIKELKLKKRFSWVVTIRGGSDLELERFVPEKKKIFREIFKKCDFVFADNKITYLYAFALGMSRVKQPFEFVPGTGGMDIERLVSLRKEKTSRSRTILWPKACEATYSKGLPVLEAIKLAWPRISPCKIVMTVTDQNFTKWLDVLPNEIRQKIEVHSRIPRKELLKIMAASRVVLLPSLVDGIPNSLYEAMACKTFPIISPLATIKTIISQKNALFAKNLYPEQIAKALCAAMEDDDLVDRVVENNFLLVKKVADRDKIGREVNKFYERVLG